MDRNTILFLGGPLHGRLLPFQGTPHHAPEPIPAPTTATGKDPTEPIVTRRCRYEKKAFRYEGFIIPVMAADGLSYTEAKELYGDLMRCQEYHSKFAHSVG